MHVVSPPFFSQGRAGERSVSAKVLDTGVGIVMGQSRRGSFIVDITLRVMGRHAEREDYSGVVRRPAPNVGNRLLSADIFS